MVYEAIGEGRCVFNLFFSGQPGRRKKGVFREAKKQKKPRKSERAGKAKN
jgi:hypothetical protein